MNLDFAHNKVIFIILLSIGFTLAMYWVLSYSISQPNSTSGRLIPEEAYIIILHDVFNQSLDHLRNITFEDLDGKFTAKYVMVKADGTIYQADQETHELGKILGNTAEPLTGGIHYGWEITANNTNYYIDSTSGQMISYPEISNQNQNSDS
ncbi:hypothetical protein [Candidatus Nitrosocosmicus arcticus]|uniref:Uncharacterized protein n=1 Tax=Candidatus Nitrosocosmicus arcticus TaxID=2035267 RepID=A0A557SVL5_9ARCH|nr:hypothetical protein [Candidatus Nitrosocosmicus arcticus]TVP40649.1 hypothetical protein NARC_60036 [Candidatus Nitrosocosmicus arcticus]